MVPRWFRRRAHSRRLPNGGTTDVRESWVLLSSSNAKRQRSFRHQCPICGADVVTVRMPNGGSAHFEGAKGLYRIKHPCLHVGEGLSRVRDTNTLDLFENW